MNDETYADWVWQRHDPDPMYVGFFWDNLREACEGIASEGGELLQCQRKLTYEHIPVPPGEFLLEASDVLHYLVLFCKQAGISMEDLALINQSKLEARDLGRQMDFELVFRAWKSEIEPLGDYLERVRAIVVALCEEEDDHESM